MTMPDDKFDELLDHVAAGRLDDLTPDQVTSLDTHLNAAASSSERLADVVPEADSRLSVIAPTPTDAEWDGVWRRIDSATPVREPTPRVIRRTIRFWQPLAAAAACLLLLIVWRLTPVQAPPGWEMRLSDHVIVHEIEIFGDDCVFVAYSDEDGSAVIWVFEAEETREGA